MNINPKDPGDTTDAFGQRMLDIAAHIHQAGFSMMMIGSGQCSVPGCDCGPSDERWSYTIGMVERGLPELVVTGLADGHALQMAHFVLAEFRAGRAMDAGDVRWMGTVALRLDELDDDWLLTDTDRMGHWFNHYAVGRSELQVPPVCQIVWSDADGYFPDEPRCAPAIVAWQPLLADDPESFPTPIERDEVWFDTSQHPSRDRRDRR